MICDLAFLRLETNLVAANTKHSNSFFSPTPTGQENLKFFSCICAVDAVDFDIIYGHHCTQSHNTYKKHTDFPLLPQLPKLLFSVQGVSSKTFLAWYGLKRKIDNEFLFCNEEILIMVRCKYYLLGDESCKENMN